MTLNEAGSICSIVSLFISLFVAWNLFSLKIKISSQNNVNNGKDSNVAGGNISINTKDL